MRGTSESFTSLHVGLAHSTTQRHSKKRLHVKETRSAPANHIFSIIDKGERYF